MRLPPLSNPLMEITSMTKDIKHKNDQTASTHTPGPWHASPSQPSDGSNCYWLHAPDCRGEIACIYGPQGGTNEANAQLITAAPTMLEALRAASEWIDGQLFVPRKEIQETVRRAVAEAEGLAA
jgi:hypothetical protein